MKKFSDETRQKIRDNMKRLWADPAFKKRQGDRISSAKKQNGLSDEQRKRMFDAQLGRTGHWAGKKFSAEHRENLSLAKRGIKAPSWNGGRLKHSGYILIHCPEHPGSKDNHVREHRLVVERIIGYILPNEAEVHHENEIRNDNRSENLIAFVSKGVHTKYHRRPERVKPEEIIFDGRAYKP